MPKRSYLLLGLGPPPFAVVLANGKHTQIIHDPGEPIAKHRFPVKQI